MKEPSEKLILSYGSPLGPFHMRNSSVYARPRQSAFARGIVVVQSVVAVQSYGYGSPLGPFRIHNLIVYARPLAWSFARVKLRDL